MSATILTKLNELSIKQKTNGLVVITVFFLLVNSFIELHATKSNIYDAKRDQTKFLVEAAYTLVQHYGRLEESGVLSREVAQQQAKTALQHVRYDNAEYFWINDFEPTVIMHPIKASLVGKNVQNVKDPHGKFVYQEIVKLAENKGEGALNYYWSKTGSEAPVEKISYIKAYKRWGWIIGSGVYVDDVDALFFDEAVEHFTWLGITLTVFVSLAYAVSVSITSPMRTMIQAVEQLSSGKADLTQRIKAAGGIEIQHVTKGINSFISRIEGVVANVHSSSEQVNDAATSLQDRTRASSSHMNSQNREIEQVATAMTEMAMTVKDVSGNASSAASAVSDANQFIEKGQSVTRDTIDSIDRLAKNIDDATVAVEKVNARTDDIGRILTVIKDIADQTNLLALNAAIEAARAGDQGRGFSVVADEVRNLAQRTQLSTTEIQEMIETLQTETSAAVALIQSGKVISGSSVELIKETGDALNSIKDSIGHIYMMSTQIATASEQQATVATQMDRSLSAINEQSNETQRELQASELSSCELAALSQQLSGEVATFKFA